MILREAIAVYNPSHPVEVAVQDAFYQNSGKWIDATQIRQFIESVLGHDGLIDLFLQSPDTVTSSIISSGPSTTVCIPCYPIELRQILKSRRIVSNYPVLALSSSAAREFFTDYPVLLVIDINKINGGVPFGSALVFSETVELKGSVQRILVQERADSDVSTFIDLIVKEEAPNITVFSFTDVPGMAMPKAAQTFKKYVINLSKLGIKNEVVKSTSPEQALDEALSREWRTLGNPHRSPEYTVQYWRNTEFWPSIVREAGAKLAESENHDWYDNMRQLGRKEETVDWLCGKITIQTFDDKEEDQSSVVFLETGTEKLRIRRSDEPFFTDNEVKKFNGCNVCAKGIRDGNIFVISEMTMQDVAEPSDQKKMVREDPEDLTKFQEGDRVRRRGRGLAFPQISGKVHHVKDGLLYIKWQGVEDLEVFDLDDTAALYAMVEKI